MKILCLLKSSEREDTIRKSLGALSEQDSIVFFYSYSTADDFIEKNIVGNQQSLDLILTQDKIQGKRAVDFIEKVARDEQRTFSNRDFKLHTLPAVLFMEAGENSSAYTRRGFANAFELLDLEKLPLYTTRFAASVKSWRKEVLDELEQLGVSFRSGRINYTRLLQNKHKRSALRILSDNFITFPRKLSYEWLENNERQIELAIDKFVKAIKRANRNPKASDERAFHELFKMHPSLIRRDNYSDFKYEPRLHYEVRRYHEPDFTLTPNFSQRTDLSVVEVKLPNELFIRRTTFHPGLYAKLLQHLEQINDYKDYLESDEFLSTIESVFGYVPKRIEYNMLIGRLEEKLKHQEILEKRLRQMNAQSINLLTYDELLEYQVKYLERIKLLSVR